jgi:LAO/AO transport system kinase
LSANFDNEQRKKNCLPKGALPKKALVLHRFEKCVTRYEMSSFLNPHTDPARFKRQKLDLDALKSGILEGDITALSRAITLAESKKEQDQIQSAALLTKLAPHTGKALRLGISGIPGVGKSTFIEAFGNYLIQEQQCKVAVLAIDPSSGRTGGSILGDKTRMESLARDERAYIRPSPAAGTLGGVAAKTRQALMLCDAAGYDVVIVETVGVGQSEIAVKSMVDCFLLLLLPGAGDELQGIKRGIMEMADIIAINKADGDNAQAAKRAAGDVKRALHLYPELETGWTIPVTPCSAIEKQGIDLLWSQIVQFKQHMTLKGHFEQNRQSQRVQWFEEILMETVLSDFKSHPAIAKALPELQDAILNNQLDPLAVVQRLMGLWNGSEK